MKPMQTSELPNINLYMDQLTTFMNERLAHTKRYEEDKVLTKTMINNYAKNNILPPPEKKQYSSAHLVTLIFIYYFKNILSIMDIQKILDPIHEKYFDAKEFSIQKVYDEVLALEDGAMDKLIEDVSEKFATSRESYLDAPEEDREFLQQFAFICELCFDIYLKKLIVEKLIDELPDRSQKAREAKEKKKAAKAAAKAKEKKK
jgi:DNA-binding transcriptional MerR regulator